ncbi:MAG: hypothetical protein QXT34_02135 [Candidatus Aenigmatarchaeota archaeon]
MKLFSFSIDIVLSIIIFSISLFFIFYFISIENIGFKNVEAFVEYSEIETKNFAKEILFSMMKTKLKELNYSEINEFFIEDDLNKSVAETISSIYISGVYANNESLKELAKNITKKFLENIAKDYCIEIKIGEESIYKNCENYSSILQTSSMFISGLEYGKPTSGYIARAWLTKYKKITTQIIDFFVSGSGWKVIAGNGGVFEYYKNFYISEDNEILNAMLFVSMHVGNIKTETALFQSFYVNSCNIKNDILKNLSYSQCEGTGTEVTCAIFSIVNITNCVKKGSNSISIVVGAPQTYHTHFHPGFKISLVLKKPEEMKEGLIEYREKIYFDKLVGRTGAWIIAPFFIPENAIFYNATLYLKVLNVEDTYLKNRNVDTSDVIIFLNSNTPIYKDGNDTIEINYPASPNYCNSIDYRNYYCSRDVKATNDINITLNLTSYLKKGTNTLSIYLNSFGDYHWGKDYAEISNESYIEIFYLLNESDLKYGEIDITKEILFEGKAENPKIFYYNRSEEKIVSSFIHLVQGFSSMINASINNISFYLSPSARAVPSHFYLYPSLFSIGNNTIEIKDIQPSGSLSPTNYILPWTSLEIKYIVKGLVGYGNVFENKTLSIEDAIQRLRDQIGNIDIDEIYIDTQDVYGVKWFFGPEILKVLVWPKE